MHRIHITVSVKWDENSNQRKDKRLFYSAIHEITTIYINVVSHNMHIICFHARSMRNYLVSPKYARAIKYYIIICCYAYNENNIKVTLYSEQIHLFF